MTLTINKFTIYGEEIEDMGGYARRLPFLVEREINFPNVKGIVRFFIDQNDSLVFGVDIRKNGRRLCLFKRLAVV